jgi:uncharacterized DUF497 family protein
MKRFAWNEEKNHLLSLERGISFEDVVAHIKSGDVLAVIQHPNHERYPGQRIFVIRINNYAWIIPFIESDEEIFLKTIFPSRKLTKQYILR